MTSDSQGNPCRYRPTASCRISWAPPPTIQELAGEENDLVAELIQSYTGDMEDRLQRIRGAMARSDAATLRCQVHAIKGSSKQMAADGVASICEQIEKAERERPVSQLADLVAQLEFLVGEVCDAMAWYQHCEERGAA